MAEPTETLTPSPHAPFGTTHWSVVLAAGGSDSTQATAALERLCRTYWYPLYAYVRRRGYGWDDAQDLTQAFFARVLQKNYLRQADRARGRFRCFLLSALSHFLADEWDSAHRQKRGGGQTSISLDTADAEDRYRLEPVDLWDAAKLYDRRWATTLLENVIDRLEAESDREGDTGTFAELRPFLVGDAARGTYAVAAERLGVTVAALKMAVSRLRSRCRELLREEIAQTVTTPDAAEEEYRALVAALQQ